MKKLLGIATIIVMLAMACGADEDYIHFGEENGQKTIAVNWSPAPDPANNVYRGASFICHWFKDGEPVYVGHGLSYETHGGGVVHPLTYFAGYPVPDDAFCEGFMDSDADRELYSTRVRQYHSLGYRCIPHCQPGSRGVWWLSSEDRAELIESNDIVAMLEAILRYLRHGPAGVPDDLVQASIDWFANNDCQYRLVCE